MEIEIRLNGETRVLPASLSIAQLLEHFELPKDRVAVERNRSIVPKLQWQTVAVNNGDELEVVHFVGGGSGNDDPFVIAGRTFKSRLIVGTGKYPSNEVMAEAHRRSGTDMVTVAVRRIDLKAAKGQSLLDFIDREKIMILPNTAACYTADDAVRTARLGREGGLSNWVKLEVIGDERTLFPDTAGLIEATKILVKEGFIVLPYTNDDLVVARRLIDAGARSHHAFGRADRFGHGHSEHCGHSHSERNDYGSSPNRGRWSRNRFRCDCRHGTRRRRCAHEYGDCRCRDPGSMAEAMNYAVRAGRLAFKSGRIQRKLYATASSPLEGKI
jgi:thiazole synthase